MNARLYMKVHGKNVLETKIEKRIGVPVMRLESEKSYNFRLFLINIFSFRLPE